MYRRDGVTREDRSGDGRIGEGAQARGLHVGTVTAIDAAGNSCQAIFHFTVHDLPVITTARRLEAADEVVVSAFDPDGGPVEQTLGESLDGGASWHPVALEQFGSYLHGTVSPERDAIWRLSVRDDEGAVVDRWFGSPDPRPEADMAFCEIIPSSSEFGAVVRLLTDRALAAPPLVTARSQERVDTLDVFQLGPAEFVARAPGAGDPRHPVVFTVQGRDHRGYPVTAHEAVLILPLGGGAAAAAVIPDSTAVEFEAVSALRRFALLVRDAAGAPAQGGLEAVSGAFMIDFPPDAVKRSILVSCDPGPRTGIFELREGRGWSCVGVPERENGSVSIERPGTYAFFSDRLPPEMTHVSLERSPSGGSFYLPVYCSVPVREEGSGIDPWSASATLDGAPLICEWDENRERLVIPIPAFIPAGRKVLAVEVSDRAGNASAGEFGFMLE
jgi:hypothetical protein